MKILFSPSEGKVKNLEILKEDSRFLEALSFDFAKREAFVHLYLELLQKGEDSEICKIFGAKKIAINDLYLCSHLLKAQTLRAIELYNGVAYKALDFVNLQSKEQEYILQSTLIFSNLFGVLSARDKIPFYKLNQGYKSKDFSLALIYKSMQKELDDYFETQEEILDLRAEIYIKAYPLKKPHFCAEFLKGTKQVSHYAKHYRGVLLRALAQNQVQKTQAILEIALPHIKLEDVKQEGLKTRLMYRV